MTTNGAGKYPRPRYDREPSVSWTYLKGFEIVEFVEERNFEKKKRKTQIVIEMLYYNPVYFM